MDNDTCRTRLEEYNSAAMYLEQKIKTLLLQQPVRVEVKNPDIGKVHETYISISLLHFDKKN